MPTHNRTDPNEKIIEINFFFASEQPKKELNSCA